MNANFPGVSVSILYKWINSPDANLRYDISVKQIYDSGRAWSFLFIFGASSYNVFLNSKGLKKKIQMIFLRRYLKLNINGFINWIKFR